MVGNDYARIFSWQQPDPAKIIDNSVIAGLTKADMMPLSRRKPAGAKSANNAGYHEVASCCPL
jgi:hypothetical protein